MAYPRYQAARAFKFFVRTAGAITLNSTTWADLPTIGTTWDAVLAAQVGDVIEVYSTGVTGAEAVANYFDAVTVVGGVATNYFAGTGLTSNQGIPGLVCVASTNVYFDGAWMRTLVASDLSAGTVTVRLRARTSTATNRTILAAADTPFLFSVKNLGPADPN